MHHTSRASHVTFAPLPHTCWLWLSNSYGLTEGEVLILDSHATLDAWFRRLLRETPRVVTASRYRTVLDAALWYTGAGKGFMDLWEHD